MGGGSVPASLHLAAVPQVYAHAPFVAGAWLAPHLAAAAPPLPPPLPPQGLRFAGSPGEAAHAARNPNAADPAFGAWAQHLHLANQSPFAAATQFFGAAPSGFAPFFSFIAQTPQAGFQMAHSLSLTSGMSASSRSLAFPSPAAAALPSPPVAQPKQWAVSPFAAVRPHVQPPAPSATGAGSARADVDVPAAGANEALAASAPAAPRAEPRRGEDDAGADGRQCAVCKKRFTRRGGLIVHMRIHTGNKPYACSYAGCKARFNDSSNCRRHERTHTGVRDHRCPACGSCYSRRSGLQRHKKVCVVLLRTASAAPAAGPTAP
jgi:hypothetical protein